MKRFLLSLVLAASLVLTSCSDPFDDSAIWETLDEYGETIKDHEQRIAALEELCKQMNTNISSLQTIVEALQNKDYVTAVVPVVKDRITIGYTITFSKSQPVTVYHGEDGKDGANGQDGKDGYTPQIGVKQDEEGVYYWTLDGEWLLDESGNKIKAVGSDGKDGQNGSDGKDGADGEDGKDGNDGQNGSDGKDGQDGKDGKDGKDGITPQLKIEDDYWYISYDNGATWTKLGKATGEDGQDGADGKDGQDGKDGANGSDGDSFFQSVTQDEECVYLTLADGTIITLPKHKAKAANCKIYYTTSDGKKLFPNTTEPAVFGAILVSNVYEDGQGVLTFDDTIISIGNNAFSGCTSLASVTIPDSVTSIGTDTFRGCKSLTSVTIGNSVTSIGNFAFQDCTSLTSVTIPDSVTSIGEYAFKNCTSLKEVYCKATTPPTGGVDMFYNNASNRNIYVPVASYEAYSNANNWLRYSRAILGYDFEKGEVVKRPPIITPWLGTWEVTSPMTYTQQMNVLTEKYEETWTDDELIRNIEIVDGAYVGPSFEGYVLVYGWDGFFLYEYPALGVYNDNKIELLNEEIVYEEASQGLVYQWLALCDIPAMGYKGPLYGKYAPYTFVMDAEGNVAINSLQGQISSTGDQFVVCAFNIYPVIGEDIYKWDYTEPAYTFSGEKMTAVKVEGATTSAKLSANKNIKIMHKMANQKFVAKTFTAARFVK